MDPEAKRRIDIEAPRRVGKSHTLKVLGKSYLAEGRDVFCYAPTERSRQALGFPIVLTHLSENTVFLFDEWDLCADSTALHMEEEVLKAGGLVVRTRTTPY